MATNFIVTGGTGFIGQQFVKQVLLQGSKIFILTRQKKESTNPQIEYIQWNPSTFFLEKNIVENNCCLIHLAGANVAGKRWNAASKKELIDSRTQSTDFLLQLLQQKRITVNQVVSASAIGYYGSSALPLTETSAAGTDFLSSICVAWEQAVAQLRTLQIPVAILRIGIVMGKGGGAVQEFMKTIKLGIAGLPGGGQQVYSWIHLQDVVAMLLHCQQQRLNDVYNAVAPTTATCKQLVLQLAKAYTKWFIAMPVPSFAIQLLIGEMSTEVLKSASISSKKIMDTGFIFTYPKSETAMQQIANDYKN